MPTRPRPLFVTGSKRSGTTLSVNLLNLHPEVFVSHESDIAWILYQARDGLPRRFRPHPLDSSLLMRQTVRRNRRTLKRLLAGAPQPGDLAACFYTVQEDLLQRWEASVHGRGWGRFAAALAEQRSVRRARKAMHEPPIHPPKREVRWLGDKKHAQLLDPGVRAFLDDLLPEGRYIHLVRHPRGVVASIGKAASEWYVMPPYFRGTNELILEQWALQETWMLDAAERNPDRVLVVRLEDLCAETRPTLERMMDFLGLDLPASLVAHLPKFVRYADPNRKYQAAVLPHSPRADRIMARYGYD